nr:hypothetical protein [Tanacetum cinerariifolium]
MGYEKPSPKLTFYKAFFSSQWKVGKGCSGVETPLFENILEIREIDAEEEVQVPTHDDVDQENVVEETADDVAQPTSPLPPSPIVPPSPPHQSPRSSSSQAVEGTSILVQQVLDKYSALAEEEVQVPAQDDVDQENVTEEIADDVAQPTSPLPPFPVIPSSPPHQSPRPPPPQATKGSSILVQQVLNKCSALVLRIEGLETANTAQQLEILKLKARVKKLERLNNVKSSKLMRLKKVGTSQRIESLEDEENVFNQGRISVDIDEEIELLDDQEKDAQVKGRQADTQAEIYNIDLVHTSKVLSMQEDTKVQEVVEVVNAAKLMTEVVTAAATQVVAASTPIPATKPAVVAVSTPISAAKPAAKPKVLKIAAAASAVSTRKRKGVVIRDPEEELHDDTPAETQHCELHDGLLRSQTLKTQEGEVGTACEQNIVLEK